MNEIFNNYNEVSDQITMLFEGNVDFRYNPVLGTECCSKEQGEWYPLNDNLVNSICSELTREFGDVYSPGFVRAMIVTKTYKDAFHGSGLTYEEWRAENLLRWITFRIGNLYIFRYNMATQKIEYKEGDADYWKSITQYILNVISKNISSYEIKYSAEDVNQCLRTAPSLRINM